MKGRELAFTLRNLADWIMRRNDIANEDFDELTITHDGHGTTHITFQATLPFTEVVLTDEELQLGNGVVKYMPPKEERA